MRLLTSYMFTSLDGFIADRDGGLDWVPIDEELMLFANAYFGTCDGMVLFNSEQQQISLRLAGSSTFEGGVVMLDHTPA